MAFAGHVGVALNVDLLVTEGDGISDSRAEYGDAKNWAGAGQRAARGTHAQGAVQRRTGRAAAGAHRRAQRGDAGAARARPVASTATSSARRGPPSSAIDAGKGEVQVWRDTKAVFSAKLADLHQVWDSVSWKICRERDNPACADSRACGGRRSGRPGPARLAAAASTPREDVARAVPEPRPAQGRHPARAGRQLARRDGLRLHRGRLRGLRRAHDRPADRPRRPGRLQGRRRLRRLQLRRHAGRRHRLGAQHHLQPEAVASSSRPSSAAATPSAWACATAARCSPSWPTSSPARRPGRASPPTAASASRRGCRMVEVLESPSLFFAGMAGSRLPIAVAHGEGYANFAHRGDAAQAIARDALRRQPRPADRALSRSTRTAAPAA